MSTLRTYNLQNPDSSNVNIELTQGSGAVVAGVATFSSNVTVSGNLTVGGVLTYEDVTNIDSVGIITARNGIDVTGHTETDTLNVSGVSTFVGAIDVDGHTELDDLNVSGVSTFVGDISIADKIVHTGDTNTAIRFPANDTFTVETAGSEAIRVSAGGFVGINETSPDVLLHLTETNADPYNTVITHLKLDNAGGNGGSGSRIELKTGAARCWIQSFIDGANSNSGGALVFGTPSSAALGVERLRISSGGDLALGTNNPAGGATSGYDRVFNIQAGSSSALSSISFGDSNATGRIESVNGNNGRIAVNASEYVTFGTGGTPAERMRIMSDGTVKIGTGTGNPILMLSASTSGTSVIQMGDTADNNIGQIQYANSDDSMRFFANNSERLRITSTARFGFNTINPPRDYCFHSGQADTNIQITNDTTGVDDSAGALIQQDGNDLYIWNKENSFMSLGTNAGERLRISNIGHITTKGNNQGNPVGIEIRNVNSNAYSHAELSLTSQNTTTSKIWCDVPNSGMRLNYNGGTSVKIDQSGNLVMANGAGIDFSATSDPASGMTSELFDNYEEGTWLPVIQNTTSAPSYSNQVGRYTRIGRVVYAQGFVQTSSGATYSNGNQRLFINGLPYARSNSNSVGYVAAQGNVQAQSFNFNGSNNDYSTTGQLGVGFAQSITGGDTGVMFYVTGSGGIRGTVKNSANAGNSFILEFNLMYIAD